MAVQKFKISLNNARIPLTTNFAQRAVVVPALDSAAKNVRFFAGGEENIDFDTSFVLFAQNAIPTAEGIKSTSYRRVIAPTVNTDFDQIFPLRDENETQVLYSPAKGKNYIYDADTEAWTSDPALSIYQAVDPTITVHASTLNTFDEAQVSRAYVDGKTFVAYSKIYLDRAVGSDLDGSIFYWDTSTSLPTLKWVNWWDDPSAIITNVPSTITRGRIQCIGSSNGYLLIAADLTVAWAPFNGTAFDYEIYANGEVTGSGYQIPEDIKGTITALVPVAGGFIIFTTRNAVGATYNSANTASPWTFREIPNAGGTLNFEQISVEGTLGAIYGYTSGGLQKISLNNAESVFPDVSDFLGGRVVESYNSGTKELAYSVISTNLLTKLTFLGNRYLIISYGMFPGIFSFALIYDVGLERWGKFRLVHVDCFAYTAPVEDALLTYSMCLDISYTDLLDTPYADMIVPSGKVTYPKQVIGFLLKTGEVKLAVIDYRDQEEEDTSESVVILGRVQLSRSRQMELQRVQAEGVYTGTTCTVVPSYDGRNLAAPSDFVRVVDEKDFGIWGGLACAENFNLHFENGFQLSTVILEASTAGRL